MSMKLDKSKDERCMFCPLFREKPFPLVSISTIHKIIQLYTLDTEGAKIYNIQQFIARTVDYCQEFIFTLKSMKNQKVYFDCTFSFNTE